MTERDMPPKEDIERGYSAAMDSVNLLNRGKPEHMDDAEWADTVRRNVEHLKIMEKKGYWSGQAIAPIKKAIAFSNRQSS